MGVTPNTRLGKIEFYESHLAVWTANATAIEPGDDRLAA